MLRSLLTIILLTTLPVFALSSSNNGEPHYLWWEAEDTLKSDFPTAGEFDPKNDNEAVLLSNKKWLNVGGKHAKHFAHYKITLGKSSTYQFYTRKFWYHGNFRYRFNDENWINIKQENHPPLLDSVALKLHVGANWVFLGEHVLSKGENRFELELLDVEGAAAFDAFVLSENSFIPFGLKKPNQTIEIEENNTWAFDPKIDPFSNDSLWDLRSLNEPLAGINGYVKRDNTNNNFLLANDKPVRFWAMNTNIQRNSNMRVIDYNGRHLAKRGFNMVRFHGHIESKTSNLFEADSLQIEQSWRLVAGMKKHGIYTTLSAYWGTLAKAHPEWKNLKGNKGGNLAGLLFFDPTLQKAYKTWLKQWLTTPNPYTQIPLAKDPAVAIFQIQNEDSLLFWTFNNIKAEHLARLEKRYTQWVLQRYKNLDNTKLHWGKLNAARDTQKTPNLTLLPLYELTQKRKGKHKQRLDDQYEFLIHLMQSWNQEVEDYLRNEIGYKGLINAGNWRTANNLTMLDGERLSYSSNQVMAINRYYNGGKHINPNNRHRAGYSLNVGDLFEGKSILFHPDKLPVNIKQVDGYPMIVSESTWSNPNPYQSEAPFLIAAYSSLNGIDGYYWFTSDNAVGFSNQFQKFPAATPALMTSHPAAALLYRQGLVKEATPSIREYRTRKDIFARKKPTVSEEGGFDPNRDTDFSHLKSSPPNIEKNTVFLKGPVVSHYNAATTRPPAIDIKNEDNNTSVIRSNTGELVWDYQQGFSTIDTPKTQGVTGFINKNAPINLSLLSVEGNTHYASLLLVPLDDEVITRSQKLLLQITTQSRPRKYRTKAVDFIDQYQPKDKHQYEGYEIENLGEMPFMIQNHQLTITLAATKIKSITATDSNGYAVADIPFTQTSQGIEFTPPPNAIYLILSTQH